MKTFRLRNYARTTLPLAVWLETPQIRRQERHTQDCMEIMFIRSGSGCCCVNEKHFPMVRGDFYVMTPMDTHEFTIEGRLTYYNVIFQENIFTDSELAVLEQFPCFNSWRSPGGVEEKKITYSANCADHMEGMLCELTRELARRAPGCELQAKSLFIQFLIYSMRHAKNSITLAGTDYDSQFSRLFDYIERHCQEKITIRQLARIVNVSPSYLGELFKKNTGLNVSGYICRYRIEKARTRLEETDEPITEIASSLAFYDSSHFSRCFRRHIGLTPREYRHLTLKH